MSLPRWSRHLVYALSLIGLLPVMGAFAIYLYVAPQLPDVNELRDMRLITPMQVYSRDGKLLAVFGEQRRLPVRYEQIPPMLVQALIAVEDQRFFQHRGVDFLGLLRIAVNNLRKDRAEGASTLTMQVARNYFLSRDRTLSRKFTEIALALKIESEFSKKEILEMYLNKIHFSHRAYGIAAAAQVYYGKTLENLSLDEMAVLVGIPKGESIYNPISYPKNALNRRNHVLSRMLNERMISQEQHDEAVARPVSSYYHGPRIEMDAPYLAEMVRQEMVTRYGEERAYNEGMKVYITAPSGLQVKAQQALRQGLFDYDRRHGFRGVEGNWDIKTQALDTWLKQLRTIPVVADLIPVLVTQVDKDKASIISADGTVGSIAFDEMRWARRYIDVNRMDRSPEKPADVLKEGDVIRARHLHDDQWALEQIPDVAAAIVVLEPNSGEILALSGGLDFGVSQFNRATQARRQPGSNFKPFIYSAAVEQGFSPSTIVNDAPIIGDDAGDEEIWRPDNDAGRYYGPISMRTALTRSTNSVSIRLFEAVGAQTMVKHVQRFGVPPEQSPPYPALALGGASELTPMEVALGYSVLANGGFLVKPRFMHRIEDNAGNVLETFKSPPLCRQCQVDEPAPANVLPRVLDQRNAYLVTDMMKDVIHRGTALSGLTKANSPLLKRSDLAGKTGTTNESREAWFSGFNPDYVATVWVGFDDHRKPLGRIEYGGLAALPVWRDWMEFALQDRPIMNDLPPPGIVTARVDRETGLLAAPGDPDAVMEIFMSEHVPTEMSPKESRETNPYSEEPAASDEPLF